MSFARRPAPSNSPFSTRSRPHHRNRRNRSGRGGRSGGGRGKPKLPPLDDLIRRFPHFGRDVVEAYYVENREDFKKTMFALVARNLADSRFKAEVLGDADVGGGEGEGEGEGESEAVVPVDEDDEDSGWFYEKEGDLFSARHTTALAHCVSADMRMGAGIATQFVKRFGRNQRDTLLNQGKGIGEVAYLSRVRDDEAAFTRRLVCYVISKERSFHIPQYDDLWASLKSLRDGVVAAGITHLAMPKIACGLDRLNWTVVRKMIKSVFRESGVKVVVFHWVPDSEGPAASGGTRGTRGTRGRRGRRGRRRRRQ